MASDGEEDRYDRFCSERFPSERDLVERVPERRGDKRERRRGDKSEGRKRSRVDSSGDGRQVTYHGTQLEGRVTVHEEDQGIQERRIVCLGELQPSVEEGRPVTETVVSDSVQTIPVVTGNRPEDGRTCQICKMKVASLKRHVWRVHLPWFWRPELACWKCCKVSAGAAELEERHLKRHSEGTFQSNGRLAAWMMTMEAVLQLEASLFGLSPALLLQKASQVTTRRYSFGESPLRVVLLEWLHNWAQGFAVQTPVVLEECPSWILMWDIQMYLLSQLDEHSQQQVRNFQLIHPVANCTFPVRVADGHCHLLDMARRFHKKKPMEALQAARMEANSSGTIATVDLILDNHVFPNSWGKRYTVPGVDIRFCVGVHPRMVNSFIPWPKLEAEFADVRCVGIGESGLDTTAPDLDAQKVLLEKVATAAWVYGKTLVLHVRGKSEEIDDLFKTVLFILDSSMVPGHPLYLHSYTGSWNMAMEFRKWSPSTYFGISWATLWSSEFKKLAGRLPIECLVLESDAPHLAPPGWSRNSPYLLGHIADQVAVHRNLPPALLLDVSRRNLSWVFRI